MDKKQFLISSVVAAVLSIGTFLVLHTLWPYTPEQIKVGETAELKDVLAGTLSPSAPDGKPTIIGTTEELKPAASAPAAEPEPATEPSAEPAADATAEAAPAEEPTQVAAAEPAPAEPEPAPAPAAAPAEDAVAAAAREMAAEAAPAPKAEAPAAAAPAPKAKPAPALKAAAASPATAAKPLPPVAPWWGGDIAGELSPTYVGSAAKKQAIVALFNQDLGDASSLNQHATVQLAGAKVAGAWELSPGNKRMGVFNVTRAGRYQLILNAGLSASGKTMKKTQQGAVDVK